MPFCAVGDDARLGAAVAEEMGLEIQGETAAFSSLIGGVQANRYDVIIGSMTPTEERAEVWNNVFVFGPGITGRNLRQSTDLYGSAWTPGGIVNLGRNWIGSGWHI